MQTQEVSSEIGSPELYEQHVIGKFSKPFDRKEFKATSGGFTIKSVKKLVDEGKYKTVAKAEDRKKLPQNPSSSKIEETLRKPEFFNVVFLPSVPRTLYRQDNLHTFLSTSGGGIDSVFKIMFENDAQVLEQINRFVQSTGKNTLADAATVKIVEGMRNMDREAGYVNYEAYVNDDGYTNVRLAGFVPPINIPVIKNAILNYDDYPLLVRLAESGLAGGTSDIPSQIRTYLAVLIVHAYSYNYSNIVNERTRDPSKIAQLQEETSMRVVTKAKREDVFNLQTYHVLSARLNDAIVYIPETKILIKNIDQYIYAIPRQKFVDLVVSYSKAYMGKHRIERGDNMININPFPTGDASEIKFQPDVKSKHVSLTLRPFVYINKNTGKTETITIPEGLIVVGAPVASNDLGKVSHGGMPAITTALLALGYHKTVEEAFTEAKRYENDIDSLSKKEKKKSTTGQNTWQQLTTI